MIRIITDSCSDLNKEIIDRYKIEVLPLKVFIDNKTYNDGQDITPQQLFYLVEKTNNLPKTSAVSVSEFSDAFNKCDDDILFIGISSRLSATMQNAQIAAKEIHNKKIELFDSLNLSGGIGLFVLEAADMRDKGLSLEEIYDTLSLKRQKINTSFIIDRLDYLHKGGRCSSMDAIVASILHIRPVIEVREDGTLGVKKKIRGTRKKALHTMLEDFEKKVPTMNLRRVFITHTGCDADALYLSNEITKLAKFDEVLITIVGSTVASHCGPNTISLIYSER